MIDDKKTLGELLSDPRIGKIAADAIRNRDLSRDEVWNKTPAQLRDEHFFFGDIGRGFRRLFNAADTGDWYYPLYSKAECDADAARRNVNVVWFPSDDPEADEKPFILLVPGGGFVNVWNLTEGWPVAAQFNRLGYHVFILTYQVAGKDHLLDREMADFARAIRLIRDRAAQFSVDWARYITCGFSAGGYLVCLWNVLEKGYFSFGLPRPEAVFPVYPLVSWKLVMQDDAASDERGTESEQQEDDSDMALFGFDIETAASSPFEIPDHAEGFPPCAVFLTETDEMVNPEQSRLLAKALQQHGIPCRLEAGPSGGHGFADGTGTCMAGWIERAVRWYEGLAR